MSARSRIGAWLDERAGLDRVWQALFARHIPAIGPARGWLYVFGGTTLFVLLLQAFTGALLAMNYAPSPDHAYDALRYIESRVLLGRFIRAAHHWGANFTVVLISLHMLRTFLFGAFKFPREATWLTGVLLFFAVFAFAFTGYLLPWDQKAYWATVVGTNLAGELPLAGHAFELVLKGAPQLGAATLARFYAFHILWLPATAALLLGAHLFLVVWHGISQPPVRRNYPPDQPGWQDEYRRRYALAKEEGMPFFPNAVLMDIVACVLAVVLLTALALHYGAPLENPADPTDVSYNPRPAWYFLFLFEALKGFPGWLEPLAAVVLPGAALLALLLVPFLDRGSRRHPLDRPFWSGLGAAALAGLSALTIMGARSPLTNPEVRENQGIVEGKRLYRRLDCGYCHQVAGRGGKIGPALDKIAQPHPAPWLEAHFRNPQALVPGSVMPKLNLLPDEINALTAYVRLLEPKVSYTPRAPELFMANCAVCHTLDGKGGRVGPDLTHIGSVRGTGYLRRYIADPTRFYPNAVMPSFKNRLTEVQIEDIARFLKGPRRQPKKS
ncbi:MAG: cytochrome b N-terminal domain-containing protein [Elusimicrobia bacterium]|nr:cytochrome b N-terminal domain-containing protein [Elusimicrobiota bacterium]